MMPTPPARILITGANGHLGRKLIEWIARRTEAGIEPALIPRALVRSERAAKSLRELSGGDEVDIAICDYADERALEGAARDCRYVVHFVGIIREAAGSRFEDAHERTCQALANVATRCGIDRVVYLSIIGSRATSENPCLASKGRAEDLLLEGSTPATVLRVPMVLGENDFAARALFTQARSKRTFLIGGGRSLQQPIDARDVLRAVVAAVTAPVGDGLALDIGGPENLSHRELVTRAAALHGNRPQFISLPGPIVAAGVALLDALLKNPPVPKSMFEILQHDDVVDSNIACKSLGIELTPLDETLAHCVGPEASFE